MSTGNPPKFLHDWVLMCIRIAVLVSAALSVVSAAAETAAVRMDLQVLPADPVSALALDREACLNLKFDDVFAVFTLNRCICIDS